ncbi:MAG: hypothetical protein NTY05_03255, partial [Rhodocyclales bacterium]|nr:hypothetical protein [Rhodocyclales bacterium]
MRALGGFGQTLDLRVLCSGFCFGRGAFGLRRSGLLLGREAGCRSAPCFGFLFGSVTGFARRLLF